MRRAVITFALSAFALGCGDATSPGLVALTGHWVSGPYGDSQGSLFWELHVGPTGHVRSRLTTRGYYCCDPDRIGTVQTLYGNLVVTGDTVRVKPDSLVIHDRFYGPNHHLVQTSGIAWWLTESAVRFERQDKLIRFHFMTYPLDAPIPTTADYRRVGCVSWETFQLTGHCW